MSCVRPFELHFFWGSCVLEYKDIHFSSKINSYTRLYNLQCAVSYIWEFRVYTNPYTVTFWTFINSHLLIREPAKGEHYSIPLTQKIKFEDHIWLDDWALTVEASKATASPTVKKRQSGLLRSRSSSARCSFSITSPTGFTNTSCGAKE